MVLWVGCCNKCEFMFWPSVWLSNGIHVGINGNVNDGERVGLCVGDAHLIKFWGKHSDKC